MPATKTRGPQRRGELRRVRLLDAACDLLAVQELRQVSIEDVARRAGIPVASAYHFYPDRIALFTAAARRYGEEVAALLTRPIPARRVRSWEDLIAIQLRRVSRFYRHNPAAQRLLIDPRAPPEVKLVDRVHDRSLSAILEATFGRHFELPRITGRAQIFFHAVEIVDLMLLLSVMQAGRITPQMQRHAWIACCAYLRAFLGPTLPRQP